MDKSFVIPLIDDSNTDTACCTVPAARPFGAEKAQNTANLLKALAHPVRVQIVDLLSRNPGMACVCDIEACFDLSQPTISHHLKLLREAGIIAAEQRGVWNYYHVRPAALEPVMRLLGAWTQESEIVG